jgi:hypothetical protein
MAINYVNIPEKDFSRGIDARSAENQIEPGFVKDLLNADVVENRVRKRPGYQGHAGNVPVRVTRMDYDDVANTVSFTLDSSVSLDTAVSLDTIRSSPIVVYGKSSTFSSGPFTYTSSVGKYYDKFTIPTRKAISAPSGTLAIPASEHGIGTTDIFCRAVESTSLTDRSYDKVLVDALRQSESTFDIEIDYSSYIDRNVFVYFADKSAVTGESYAANLTKTMDGSETFSIPTASHNLGNYNIICQVQQDTGAERLQVAPDSFIIEPNGDVSITLDAAMGTSYRVLLSSAPTSNAVSGVVGASSSGTVTISSPEKPWVFFGIYLEQTPGGNKELVYSNETSYNATLNEFTLSFENAAAVARNFIVYYEYGDVRSNRLTVSDATVNVTGTDNSPQITLWGLDHSEIYTTKVAREGWVTHVDSYRRSGEQRLICGLGGNIFSSQTYSEAASTYLYNTLYPNLFARTSSSRVLGPLLWDTGETPERTRGYITGDASGTNWAAVTAVEYDSGNTWTKYTLSIPNMQVLDSTGTPTTIASVVATSGNLNDYLTVQGMSYARHNGEFKVMQVQSGVDEVYFWVENSTNSSDYDDDGVYGEAGVFTDQLNWSTTAPFVSQDTLSSISLGTTEFTVYSSSSTVTVLTNQTYKNEIPGGLLFVGARTSSLIPLRESNPSNAMSTENLVRGDMLSYTGIPRLLRILNINADSSRVVDITSDGTTATVELQSGDTSYLTSGMKVLITNAGEYSGEKVINSIISATEFTFDSTETASVTGATLVGETIEIDESLSWSDSSSDAFALQVARRWIPVEAPEDTWALTPATYVRHLDTDSYSDQSFLRSTMVQGNMYLTNQMDEVQKFDGTSIYRAGLPSWQPGLFVSQDTASTAKIVTDNRSFSYTAISASEGKLTITSAEVDVLPVGSKVRLSGSSQTYTIRAYPTDGTAYYLLVDRALDGTVSATGTVSEIATFRYYYRLNAVDANDNIIASSVAGYQDHVVEMTANAAIYHKLVGFPTLGNYDYDRLEVQIYRTKKDTAAPFYLITTLPLDFNNTTGYVQFTDAFADSDLTQLDVVNTALKGAEIGTNWQEPNRAKYITSSGNRLILGNLKDYPEWDIQVVGNANLANSDFAGDTLLFRKDNTDNSTTTNMVDRIKFEWKNGITGNLSAWTIGTDEFSFDTSINTSAVAGDWIYLTYSSVATTGRVLTYSGWWQIASVAGATVTVNLTGAASATAYPDRYVIATDPTDVPVLLGTDGNLGMVNGDSFDLFDSMRRMSMAINTVMRQTDISISGMEEFTPWLQARGGNDLTSAGNLLVRMPMSSQLTPEVLPTFSGYNLFINQVRRISGVAISATTRLYPSRILISYENYPEIFDNANSILDIDSDSAIDINPADGQEITGVIPFFGEAAFTASQQAAILVVFKTNSVYLVDINEKAAGRNAVQRIETEGLGCTAPYSIAVTKGGIIFANESGIYCLRRNQSIQYIGRYMERPWTEQVNLNSLELIHGHHYGAGRSYKVSVPIQSDETYSEPSEAYVYNHTGESEGNLGAWSKYDNHPVIGWANLGSDAFLAGTNGRVYSVRRTGQLTDFRDDNESVQFSLETRPNDFGNSGIRKTLDTVIVHYRSGANNTGTVLNYALDLENEYSSSTTPILNKQSSQNGMGDAVTKAIETISHSLERRKAVYFGLQIQNDTIDENIEIAGIDLKVGGLADTGIKEAQSTKE